MGDKTAVLNKEKYDLLVGKIDMMFVDGVITRKNNSIFKDKLFTAVKSANFFVSATVSNTYIKFPAFLFYSDK